MLISKAFLESIEKEYVDIRSETILQNALQKHKLAPRPGECTVFLSHKHDEYPELRQTVALLSSLAVFVYVDWMDEDMPLTTSRETAEKLKQKIRTCSKFIFLATDASISSKWCNWELGYGDAQKFSVGSIALLPVTQNDGSWKGSEYLRIYPAIESRSATSMGDYVVRDRSTEIPLEKWLGR